MGRRRKKPWAKDELLKYDSVVSKPTNENKEKLLCCNELHLELGTGRGQFLTTLASIHNHIGFIGLEIKEEILLEAVRKAEKKGLNNMKFLWEDAMNLESYFDKDELDRIYINFCDPWPKRRHAKRRLTHKGFLCKYKAILKKDGEIHFKTDNEGLFEYSLNEMSEAGFRLKDIYLDLYRDENIETVKTEYEDKFIELGMKIYSLKAVNR